MTTGMRAVSLLLAVVMGLSLSLLDARPAYACSCISLPLQNEVRISDAVFSGGVQSIDEDSASPDGGSAVGRVAFTIQDTWKGAAVESVDVYGQGDGTNCYNTFEEGEAYLVYASRAEGAEDTLINNGCGETKPLATAEEDLQLLGPPVDELPETGGPAALPFGGLLLATGALLISTVCAVGILLKRTHP